MSRRINCSTVPTLAVGEAFRFPSGNGVRLRFQSKKKGAHPTRIVSCHDAVRASFSSNIFIAAVFATVSVFQATSLCRHLPGSRNRRSKTSR